MRMFIRNLSIREVNVEDQRFKELVLQKTKILRNFSVSNIFRADDYMKLT